MNIAKIILVISTLINLYLNMRYRENIDNKVMNTLINAGPEI